MYLRDNRVLKYMKQKLIELKKETDKSKIILGNFNASLLVVGRTNRQKSRKNIENFNNKVNQADLVNLSI